MVESEPALQQRPTPLRRGTNQSGVRLYNERLVLSLIRDHGALPKADIARQTGLSPPTVQAIVRQLEADGLLLRQEAQRGRVGQPSVPLALNPDGAFSLGLKIGRRSADLILMDFLGGIRSGLNRTYAYPTPEAVLDFVREGSRSLRRRLPPKSRTRIAGLGVATPFELWNWEEQAGAPPGGMQGWRDFDLQAEVEDACGAPVYLCNDAAAACAAELLFGRTAHHSDILYIFVAWFIGGGLVLNGNLFTGRSGYAGSVGQILVPSANRAAARPLLHSASLFVLARQIAEAGGDPSPIWESPDDWRTLDPYLDTWLDETAGALALAIVSSLAVVAFQAAVIDGAFPTAIRQRLAVRVQEKIGKLDPQGLPPFQVVEGSIGNAARAIGGASLPFLARFMRDRDVLFHDPAVRRPEGGAVHLSRPSSF